MQNFTIFAKILKFISDVRKKRINIFCPNPECYHYKKEIDVIKWRTYKTKNDDERRQRFKSKTCGCTFSETVVPT